MYRQNTAAAMTPLVNGHTYTPETLTKRGDATIALDLQACNTEFPRQKPHSCHGPPARTRSIRPPAAQVMNSSAYA